MSNILVSHEVPKKLLQESRKFNDYDYALVHLFKEDEEYYNFFKESLRMGRTVYLDNSLFELEQMFDHEEFAHYVKELGQINPDNFFYIVPDVLEDGEKTIKSFKEFKKIISKNNLPGKIIGVVQGDTLESTVECYEFMSSQADVIAISFDYSWYEDIFNKEENKYHSWMKGRQFLMNILKTRNILSTKPHHLLGCGLPQEFKMYSGGGYSVRSVDTSNPVVLGMHGIKYSDDGVNTKVSTKLVDLFERVSTDEEMKIINHNIKKFKEFCS